VIAAPSISRTEQPKTKQTTDREIDAILRRARHREFYSAATGLVRRVAAAVAPPKKRKHKESDSGKAAIAPRRRLSPFAFANAAKATGLPFFVQRLMRFFAAAIPGTEAMHTDARYRDTLGTAASAAVLAPEITASSLDL
jgi:hypothetical protein